MFVLLWYEPHDLQGEVMGLYFWCGKLGVGWLVCSGWVGVVFTTSASCAPQSRCFGRG